MLVLNFTDAYRLYEGTFLQYKPQYIHTIEHNNKFSSSATEIIQHSDTEQTTFKYDDKFHILE